mgnify:CR=1 FL=1
MKTQSEYLALINEAIAAIPYPQEPSQLYEPIAYTMALGGKRLRPVAVLMACDALGGKVDEAMNPAVGLELFHNFTLLHDDLMDQADVRRGKPTVCRRWDANTAVLSGDTMLTMATQYIARAPRHCMPQVMELFNHTAMEIYEGQQWDMDYERLSNVSVDDYMKMIRLKTSVLIGCACKMGAIVAGAPQCDTDLIYEAGVNLGLAFQLQDDLLDVWGDPATFGKETGCDIMNNKKTFLLINALRLAQGDDAHELRRWLADAYALRDQKVAAVTRLYERLHVRELAQEAIDRYSRLAEKDFSRVAMSPQGKEAFIALAKSLMKRQK